LSKTEKMSEDVVKGKKVSIEKAVEFLTEVKALVELEKKTKEGVKNHVEASS